MALALGDVASGQAVCRDKRIVQGIHHQGGHLNELQMRLGRGTVPVVVGVFEAVQGGGEHIVKVIKGACRAQGGGVEQTRMLGQFFECLGFHAAQKHAGVDLAVEAPPHGLATGGQVYRGRDAGHGACYVRRLRAGLLGPTQQGIAAKRHTHHHQGPSGALAQALQDPANFFKVARVVGAGGLVELATATPKMRHDKAQTLGLGMAGKGQCVVAA